MDYEAELRKIHRRDDEELLAVQSAPPFWRYLFFPVMMTVGGLAGWLAGRDMGGIEVWVELIAGFFLVSVAIHWLIHKIGSAWIGYKYRQYDDAASLSDETAARAFHQRVEFAVAAIVVAAVIALVAAIVWTDAVQPLVTIVRGWY